jgi:hypothetical protein
MVGKNHVPPDDQATLVPLATVAAEYKKPSLWKPGQFTDGALPETVKKSLRLEWLAPDKLSVERRWMRTLSRTNIARIAAEFDYVVAGAIIVNRRADGTLVVLDGVNRAVGAMHAQVPEVLAVVAEGLEALKESRKAADHNRYRKTPRAHEYFLQYLEANDPDAHRIKAAVEAAGLTVYLPGTPYDASIQAVGALYNIYESAGGGHDGAELIEETCRFLVECWGVEHHEDFKQYILKGTARFLASPPEDWTGRRRNSFVKYLRSLGLANAFGLMQEEQRRRKQFANVQGDISGDWLAALVYLYTNMPPGGTNKRIVA